MSVKIFDTMTTATPNFPLAYAEKINIVKEDGSEADIQTLYNNKELGGGGGDSSTTLTQQEYEALPEEQKLGRLYYTYDTKRIYKNGVQYGASDAEGIGYNNAESGIQATTVQGAIDNVVEKVDGLISDTTSSTTSTWSSSKIASKIPFEFGIDENGNYGYKKVGADSVIPFKVVEYGRLRASIKPNSWTYTDITFNTHFEKTPNVIAMLSSVASNGCSCFISNISTNGFTVGYTNFYNSATVSDEIIWIAT